MTQSKSRKSPSGTVDEIKDRLTFTYPLIVDGATVEASAAMPNSNAGDVVSASPVGALTSGLAIAYGRVAVDGTVILALVNAGANTTPGALVFDVEVAR